MGEEEASARRAQRGRDGGGRLTRRPGGTVVAWRGSARTATTIPMTCRQAHHHTSTRQHHGEVRYLEKKLEVVHGRNPRCGRRRSRGRKEAIREISWIGWCAIVRSTRCAPSRRLTPARVVGIEGDVAAAIQLQELGREEEGGGAMHQLAGSGSTEPARSSLTRWAWCPTGGTRGPTGGLGE
jgi:hypothetical protein